MSTKTVLVVDDEDSIRLFMTNILRRKGFNVFEAADGQTALVLAGSLQGAIDVLVTDIRVPKMDGFELAAALLSSKPAIPVVYISGYCTTQEIEEHHHPEDGQAFVAKPFLPKALTDAIEAVLGRG